jgi:hypothetical protein
MAERAVSGNFTSPTTTYGRYSLQNAANNGVLDQFAVNGGFNNAARWGDRLVRNNNTGTGYIFRSGTTHPYDAAVDAGTKVIPWATSLGTPVVSTTLHNLTEDYFFNYKAEFNYIKNHFKQFQAVPDKLTFASVFPEILNEVGTSSLSTPGKAQFLLLSFCFSILLLLAIFYH